MGASEWFLSMIGSESRALLWRLGRKLYCIARGDVPNQPERNGEYWLLDQFLSCRTDELVFLDVGANMGDWSSRAVEIAARRNATLLLYAFEPSAGTRALLEQRLSHHRGVRIIGSALSSVDGEAWFYGSEIGAGTNSLSVMSGDKRERVTMTTLDSFLTEHGIDHIDMLKIDTEGFDFQVLKGGERALSAGLVEIVQFEYNWRWLINHVGLRDVFEYIKDKPYRLGKLVGNAIETFDQWHFEMDRYFENNYVLIRHGSSLLGITNRARFDESNCARRTRGSTRA
jgi:FkbM family methyltransferase